MRTAIELAIDTGRRPEELCGLAFDCVARDDDHMPVLVYDNYKANRLGRRLPITESTAQLIVTQQGRVRSKYPHTARGRPQALAYRSAQSRRRQGHHARSASRSTIGPGRIACPCCRHADGVEFDQAKFVLYAYRHTYAQRHADAGVGIDVLCELMDHRKLDTTKQYYRVGETRRREAVDRVAALQFDRHGVRTWRTAPETPRLRARPPLHRRGRRSVRHVHRAVQRQGGRKRLPVPLPLRRLRPLPDGRFLPSRSSGLPRRLITQIANGSWPPPRSTRGPERSHAFRRGDHPNTTPDQSGQRPVLRISAPTSGPKSTEPSPPSAAHRGVMIGMSGTRRSISEIRIGTQG